MKELLARRREGERLQMIEAALLHITAHIHLDLTGLIRRDRIHYRPGGWKDYSGGNACGAPEEIRTVSQYL